MLVVIVVLSLAIGLLLYSLEHNSIGAAATSSGIRGRALSPLSRGEPGTSQRPTTDAERLHESAARPGH
jgi:hypothetical protein